MPGDSATSHAVVGASGDTRFVHYRRFGRTEMQMPVFSCGGMRFQQSWSDRGQPIRDEAQEKLAATVHRAVELGITHIETARGYGTSERQLGMLMADLDRDRLILQTKVAPTHDPAVFEAHVLESLDRLKVSRVDLLALHGVNTYEKLWWALRPGGCLEVARRLQDQGLVGHVGFSTHGTLEMIQQAIEADFDYINLHWYWIFQRNWPAIEAAAARDMGVFIISPSDKGGRLYDPSPKLSRLCAPLHPLVFNTLFCLSHPQVHTLSIGAANPGDFDLALTALDHDPEAFVQPAERLLAAMAESIGEDAWEQIGQGIPGWDHCPGLINVEMVVLLRAVMLAWGMDGFAKWRYGMLGTESEWIPGMDARHAADFDFSRALSHAPLAEEIQTWLGDAHGLLGGD
jgi:predicted aldo/keto reductase-like oxidoreductase